MTRRCARRGHKFAAAYPGAVYVFCRRWRCSASAVSAHAPAELARDLHNAIPAEHRFPPVTIHEDGSYTVLPGHEHEEPRPL